MLSALENRRQIVHLLGGVLYVVLIYFDILTVYVAAALIGAYILLSLIFKKYKIPILYDILKQLDRPKDLKTFPIKGNVWYAVGVFISLLIFPKDVAMASLIILALGDSIAPLIGQYGKLKHPFNKKKYIEGSIAGAIAGFLGALIFVSWYVALPAAVAAMIAEGVGLKVGRKPVDDNIIIPFVAGVVILFLRMLI